MGSVVSNLGEHSNMRIAFFLIVVATINFTSARPKRRNDELMFNPSMVRKDGPLNMEALNMLHADAVKYGQGAKNNKWFEAVDAKTLDGMITQMNTMNRWFAKVVKYWDDFTSAGAAESAPADAGEEAPADAGEEAPADGADAGGEAPAEEGEGKGEGEGEAPAEGDAEAPEEGDAKEGEGEAKEGEGEGEAAAEGDAEAPAEGDAEGDAKEGEGDAKEGEGDAKEGEGDAKEARRRHRRRH